MSEEGKILTALSASSRKGLLSQRNKTLSVEEIPEIGSNQLPSNAQVLRFMLYKLHEDTKPKPSIKDVVAIVYKGVVSYIK